MREVLWIGFVTGSDPEHDVGGVRAPSTSPIFGEHRAQIRIVGRRFYINQPDPDQALPLMASDPPTINQPASKSRPVHRRRCSLTSASHNSVVYRRVHLHLSFRSGANIATARSSP